MLSSNRQERIQPFTIDGRTRILGVFGYPVEHSLSPAMHNAAITALGLPYAYIPFHVHPDKIGSAIESLRSLNIIGVNLTIPHKERVLPFLDEITPEAHAIGAVNTVHNIDGRLIGHNTDGVGFVASLAEAGVSLRGKRTVVFGAGGAARSIVYRLSNEGAGVVIANRTLQRAQELMDHVRSLVSGARVTCLGYDDTVLLRTAVAESELVVNTTSLGMSPHEDAMPPIPVDVLHPRQLVYDLIYNPTETRLLAAAKAKGARVINGVSMLVRQGAASFSIWTGVYPPVDIMEKTVISNLVAAEI